MKKSKVTVGMKVTCKRPVEAYYSNYAGNPKVTFEPGMIGTVAAVDVPSVHRENVSFCCVDFDLNDDYKWRCSLLYDNIVPVS